MAIVAEATDAYYAIIRCPICGNEFFNQWSSAKGHIIWEEARNECRPEEPVSTRRWYD